MAVITQMMPCYTKVCNISLVRVATVLKVNFLVINHTGKVNILMTISDWASKFKLRPGSSFFSNQANAVFRFSKDNEKIIQSFIVFGRSLVRGCQPN